MILSKWIESILYKLDSAERPNAEEMQNALSQWFLEAQRLEAGAGDTDLIKENQALQSEVKVLRAELDSLRAAQASGEREESYEERPKEQNAILEVLPVPGRMPLGISR